MTFLGFLFKNLLHRKARTLLTVLGVAVAMATLVALRGVAHGFESSFLENFERRNADLIVSAAGVTDQLRSDLDERIGPQIAQIEGVARVMPGLLELVDVQRGESTISVMIHGWNIGGPQFDDLTILSGRHFRPEDRQKILLGKNLADNLKKQVGDWVELQQHQYEVVGIYQSYTHFETSGAIMPLPELQTLMMRKGSVTGFSVTLDSTPDKADLMEMVRARIELLTNEDGDRYRITATPTKEYVRNAMPVQLARGMAWVTSILAVLIGAISMLNTMIMSVMERIKEVGVLRAIGWRKRRVVLMILGEALILSLAATIVGSVIAFAALRWLAHQPQTGQFLTGELSPIVLLEGLFMTLIVAILGGSYPAYRAACWMPAEALRHE